MDGVAAITFKGPVLAAMAYGSIELRQFSDLDILVRQADLPSVAKILTAERYLSPHTRREGLATGYFQEFEDAFFAPDGLGAVDVHWNITPRSFRFAPGEEALWRRAREVDFEFGKVQAIAPDDLLLYICVHAAKHGWTTLGSICDVAETVSLAAGNRSDADTRRGDHARQPADVSDRHLPAHELVGAPIPSKLLTIARDDRAVAALARRVARQTIQRRRSRPHRFRSMGGSDSLDRGRPRTNPLRRPPDAGADDGRL